MCNINFTIHLECSLYIKHSWCVYIYFYYISFLRFRGCFTKSIELLLNLTKQKLIRIIFWAMLITGPHVFCICFCFFFKVTNCINGLLPSLTCIPRSPWTPRWHQVLVPQSEPVNCTSHKICVRTILRASKSGREFAANDSKQPVYLHTKPKLRYWQPSAGASVNSVEKHRLQTDLSLRFHLYRYCSRTTRLAGDRQWHFQGKQRVANQGIALPRTV